MKKLATIILLYGLLLSNNFSYSQGIIGKNIIKWNLSALALSQYSIQYERVLALNRSYAIGFGISPDVELPFKTELLDRFGGNSDARHAIESTRFTKITVTPEYRFYMSKNAPKGFYVATFIRYTNMLLSSNYPFTTNSGVQHNPHVEGKFSGVGGGAMIGTQFLLGPSMVLDLWIVGPFIGIMNASFHGTDDMSDMTDADKAKLESDIESVNVPLWKVDATVGNNVIDVKLKGPFYGVRLAGVSFGFRF